MSQTEPCIGIDLGTWKCCVGYWNPESKSCEILSNEVGENTTPSWVSFCEDGNILIGKRAFGKQNWVYDAKRIMGNVIHAPSIQEKTKHWSFTVEEGERDRCVIKLEGIERRC